MPIISLRDNENSRWKRNAKKIKIVDEREMQKKKNKGRKEQGGTEALLKGWELNDFVVHLSLVFSN